MSAPIGEPDDSAGEEDEAPPASRRRLAAVLAFVAATLLWAAAASAYLRTGKVRISLIAVGLVFAVLPLVMRAGGDDGDAPRDDDADAPGNEE